MNRTRTSKNVKRLIVWLLMLTMVFSLLPMAAFADEAVEEPKKTEKPKAEEPKAEEPTDADDDLDIEILDLDDLNL